LATGKRAEIMNYFNGNLAEKNDRVRTVDGYINSVRMKLKADTKNEMMKLISETDFYSNYKKMIKEKEVI
jgi:DNA-binding response OmpR family regulator